MKNLKNSFKKLGFWIVLISVSVFSLNPFSISLFSFSLFSMDVNLGNLCPESPPVVIVTSQVEPLEIDRISGTVAFRPVVAARWQNTGHEWWNVLHNLE